MQLLHIDSAITGAHSVSRQLTAQIVAAYQAAHPAVQVDYLDLVANAPAHFTMDAMAPRTGQTDGLSEAQKRENAVSEQLVTQFLAADVVVIGASVGAIGTALSQQHLRNVLAYLDMPTLGQPEAFIHAKDGLFDADGNVGAASREFLQGWVNKYVAWVKQHSA